MNKSTHSMIQLGYRLCEKNKKDNKGRRYLKLPLLDAEIIVNVKSTWKVHTSCTVNCIVMSQILK